MPFDVYLNVAIGGVLTGLVYGLMALGLSVIFGVVRVVNFAHGEMMTIAMFIAVVLSSGFHLDPLILLIPIAAVLFAFGYVLQLGLINPFVTRPEHSQFLLLVALAIIITNTLAHHLRPGRAIGADRLLLRELPDRPDHRRRRQGLCRRGGDRICCGACSRSFVFARRQGDPRLRRQLTPARWWSGSTSSGFTRSPSGSAPLASAPPARC